MRAGRCFYRGVQRLRRESGHTLDQGVTGKSPIEYSVGEKMTFTLTLEKAGSLPKGLDIVWTRTGDDGKKESGKAPADPNKLLVLNTSLDRPGVKPQEELEFSSVIV